MNRILKEVAKGPLPRMEWTGRCLDCDAYLFYVKHEEAIGNVRVDFLAASVIMLVLGIVIGRLM